MATKRDLTIKKRRIRPEAEEQPEKKSPKKKAKKRRHGRSMLWPILFRLLLVAAVVMLGVLVWRNWDRLAPSALVEWMDRLVTGGEGGDGYPVDITGSSVVAMEPFGSNAAVLTDASLLLYNSAGAQIAERGHTYTDPLLESSGNYLLVAELGGTRYMLGNKKETLFTGQVNNTIRAAAVDSDGQVALATESSQSYTSEVVVFDREGKELFHWYSADLTVIDVALTTNGKQVAVLGLSAGGGEMKSTLQIFSLAGKQGKADHTYSAVGPMMVALHCFGNGRVGVVGDTAAWVYDPDDNATAVTAYENSTLLGYAFSQRGIGLVTRGYGESSGGTLTVITPAGKQTAATAFSGDFRHLAAADNGFYLLTNSALYNADTVGFAAQTTSTPDGLMTVEMNGKPLVLGLTTLSRCEWE